MERLLSCPFAVPDVGSRYSPRQSRRVSLCSSVFVNEPSEPYETIHDRASFACDTPTHPTPSNTIIQQPRCITCTVTRSESALSLGTLHRYTALQRSCVSPSLLALAIYAYLYPRRTLFNMDDPNIAWPAWKFGLKRDDLFTTLHDQYNTYTLSLQDPEAFHADVYEISHEADSTEEFHRLMADRRGQRLRELHESLESLAVEIIANPKLMDSPHWNYAIQLFRTKSFDSLVRYFASYLPEGYMARDEQRAYSARSSFSDTTSVHTASTTASSVDDASAQYSLFLDGSILKDEPDSLDSDSCHHQGGVMNGPLSPPESDSTVSECSAPSPSDDLESRSQSTNPPSRSMSFSGSDCGPCGFDFRHAMMHDDDETWQSDSVDTAVTSVSDCAESRSSLDSVDDKEQDLPPHVVEDEDDDLATAQFPEDAFDAFDTMNEVHCNATVEYDGNDTVESDTPTPRQEGVTTSSYLDYKKSALCRRLPSPSRRSPPPRGVHRAAGPLPCGTRRSPDEAHSKIQKPSPEPMRKRPKGRI